MLRGISRNLLKPAPRHTLFRANMSFGQIRKKDENGNIIGENANTVSETKVEDLSPEQKAAIQRIINAKIEMQLRNAFAKSDPEGAAKLAEAEKAIKELEAAQETEAVAEPTFTVTMSQLQQIRKMETEMQNLRSLLRQSELFAEQVEPAKDYGLHKNLPLIAFVLGALLFITGIRYESLRQEHSTLEADCNAKITSITEEATLASSAAKASFEALALFKAGKTEMANDAAIIAAIEFKKYSDKVAATQKQVIDTSNLS